MYYGEKEKNIENREGYVTSYVNALCRYIGFEYNGGIMLLSYEDITIGGVHLYHLSKTFASRCDTEFRYKTFRTWLIREDKTKCNTSDCQLYLSCISAMNTTLENGDLYFCNKCNSYPMYAFKVINDVFIFYSLKVPENYIGNLKNGKVFEKVDINCFGKLSIKNTEHRHKILEILARLCFIGEKYYNL